MHHNFLVKFSFISVSLALIGIISLYLSAITSAAESLSIGYERSINGEVTAKTVESGNLFLINPVTTMVVVCIAVLLVTSYSVAQKR